MMEPTRNRRAFTKRRGSALVFVAIMSVAITTVVIGTVQLNMVAATKAQARVDEAKSNFTADAEEALVKSICKDQSITLPYSNDCMINGFRLSYTVSDNSASQLRTVKLTATGRINGVRYSYDRVFGGRQTTHPFYYAFWTDQDLDLTVAPITTNGSIMTRGSMLLGTSTIAGDVMAGVSVDAGTATVDRNITGSVATTTASGVDRVAYGNESSLLDILLSAITNISPLSGLSNGHYKISYYKNVNRLNGGIISGVGTCVFEKNMTIKGDMTYADSSSRVVFIVDGDLTIDKAVSQVDGMWYVTGKLNASGTSTPLVNGRGSFAVFNSTNNLKRPLNITFDDAFWTDRNEAVKHCVPGFWPTPVTGIMR